MEREIYAVRSCCSREGATEAVIAAICVGNVSRELLDLFAVAEDPVSGKAAIIYTDTALDTWTSPTTGTHPLPEIVLDEQ